jgi:hypothetical protein
LKVLVALLAATPLFTLQLFALQQAPFRLEPGEFRWIPFTVNQTPTEIACRFQVMAGGPTVHLELLPMSDFRLFNRGRRHETLAASPRSQAGSFRQTVDDRGQYAVVVVNEKNAPAVMVSLEVSTEVNPSRRVVSRELPAGRRMTVILISFALFFVTVTWSALKLLRVARTP